VTLFSIMSLLLSPFKTLYFSACVTYVT